MFKFDVEIGRFAEEARALLGQDPVVVALQEAGWLRYLSRLAQRDHETWHPVLEISVGTSAGLTEAKVQERDWSGLIELGHGSARRVLVRRFAMVGGLGEAFTATIAASPHREHIDATLSHAYASWEESRRATPCVLQSALVAEIIGRGIRTGVEFELVRNETGLQAKELAVILDVRPETVSRWEAGEQAIPRPIAFALGELYEHPTTARRKFELLSV